eukprot:2177897-Amphidinium_carterae.1
MPSAAPCCARVSKGMHLQHIQAKHGTYLVSDLMQAGVPDGQKPMINTPLHENNLPVLARH